MRYSFFLIFIFLTSVDSVAQHSVYLQPDRPGLSTGTYTMTPKMYQVEFGYQRSFGRAIPRVDSSVFPEFLIRTGLTSQVEISLFWPGWESQFSDNSSDQRSISSVALGGKVRLHESEHLNFTAIAQFNFAFESPTSSFNVDPTLGVVWDYDGKGAISWFGALQLSSEGIKNDRTTFGQFAIGSTIQISERLSIFTEYFNSISVSSNPEVYHPINGGFTFLVSPKIQFDLYAGVGLNKNTDHFIGSGFAVLF